MDVRNALQERRAEKYFDPEFRISDSDVEDMLRTALLSPTAFNIQHWRVVWVKDPALRGEIRKVAWDQEKVTDAAALFVLAADLKAWQRDPQRYWDGAPEPVQEYILNAINTYYDGKPDVERDECMRSLGMLAMSMMLLCQERGWHTCPMDGFDFNAVGNLVDLPEDHVIGMMLAVGRKSRDAWPRVGKLSLEDVLYTDGFR